MLEKLRIVGNKVLLFQHNGEIRDIGSIIKRDDYSILFCPRQASKHFFKQTKSWAIDKQVVDCLMKKVKYVVIRNTENSKKFRIETAKIPSSGKTAEFKHYGEQYFVPLDAFEVVKGAI